MTVLPIVGRELRVAARRSGTYWLRVVAALAALIVGSGMLLPTLLPMNGQRMMGGPIFGALTWLSLAAALSAGLFFTSDCLSEEKREGTLGFLFLTDLRSYDVVLGKLFVTSLRCVFALLAIFPVLAITLLLGGVEAGQFWRTMLALAHALFFSLAVGMFVSALSRHAQPALAMTLLLLLLLVAGGPLVDVLTALAVGAYRPLLSLSSPGYVFMNARDARHFWSALLVSQGVAWSLLALACLVLPRSWQEKSARRPAGLLTRPVTWSYGGAKRRKALRKELLETDPVMWLGAREPGQAFWLWFMALTFLGGFVLMVVLKASSAWWQGWQVFGTMFSLALYLWVAAKASQFFTDARRNGMIELLLATPLTSSELAQGPWRALVRVFGLPVLCLVAMRLGANILSQEAGQRRLFGTDAGPDWQQIIVIAVMAMGVFLANLVALGWFGLWMGLTSRNTRLATLKTIVFVQVIPWFAVVLISWMVIPLALFSSSKWLGSSGGFSQYWPPLIFTVTPALLTVAKDVILWRLARRKLSRNFRELAMRAVIPLPPSGVPPVISAAR